MKGFKSMISMLLVATLTFTTVYANDGDKKDTKAVGIKFSEGSWAAILKKAKAEKKIVFLMHIQPGADHVNYYKRTYLRNQK